MLLRWWSLAFACGALPLALHAGAPTAPSFDVKAAYTKQEFQIPMRDGVRLFTAVYTPKDVSQRYPILLTRTPYGVSPYGAQNVRPALGPSDHFMRDGNIFVYQDVRGRWMSEGEFVHVRPHRPVKSSSRDLDESTDTYDTIEWLVQNLPNHNGRVGLWGISYPGFYVSAGIIDSHPALKAASPQAPVADWFLGDDFHHHGAFYLMDAFNWLSGNDRPRPRPTSERGKAFDHGRSDAYRFFLELGPLRNANERHFKGELSFWNELMRHPNYDGFWKERNLLPHLKNIRCAVMTVGGLFDAEDLTGPLRTYQAIERMNPGLQNTLVMGPWYHGGWARSDGDQFGDISFGSKTAAHYREHVEFPFFNYHLKGKGANPPEALLFNTGANAWRALTEWPPKDLTRKPLHFHAGGQMSFPPPSDTRASAHDAYVSDPAKPVPYFNDVNIRRRNDYMLGDQRFAATRPDVLVYQTTPLVEDLTLVGPIPVELFVSSTGTDADFVVKLVDVFPEGTPDPEPNPRNVRLGGYQMLVRAEVMRARYRNSFEKPKPLRPGQVTRVSFTLPDVCHTFQRGHRLMVQVQSSWFPLVDRNPQKFVNIYQANESDYQTATQRLWRTPRWPSRLLLGTAHFN